MKKMTKNDIINDIFEKTSHKKKSIQEIVDATFACIKESLIGGSNIELRGFGIFEVRERKGRSGLRNPKTGELFKLEPHSVVIFRPGKEVKTAVRKNHPVKL
ncbi:MAG: HU family DNA-binding protein [Treponemataceae bacterium]